MAVEHVGEYSCDEVSEVCVVWERRHGAVCVGGLVQVPLH